MKQGFVKGCSRDTGSPGCRCRVQYRADLSRLIDVDLARRGSESGLYSRSCVLPGIRVVICFRRICCWKSAKKGIVRRLRHIPVDKDVLNSLSECRLAAGR